MISNTQKIFTILACGLIFSACTSTSPTMSQKESSPKTQEEQGLKGKYSFKSLLSQNKSLSCTYKFTDEENKIETTGKAYISGKKVLQQTKTTNLVGDKKVVEGSVYTDGEYVYIWSPNDKQSAMKMKIENKAEVDDGVKTDVAGAQENMEKEYDLDCMPWKVDESIFALPTDINFKDFSEMIKGIPSMPQVPSIPKKY